MRQTPLTAQRWFKTFFLIAPLVLSVGIAYIFYLYWEQRAFIVSVRNNEPSEEVPVIHPAPVIEPEVLFPNLLPAFPGAEGAGAATAGGRGGQVIEVTNLNDSGPGSLRQALDTPGPRIVVFRVGGVIEVNRSLIITEPYITIAGQTAPGSGITLSGAKSLDGEVLILRDVHDVVIRYLRIRSGQLGTPGQGQSNIAIDSGARSIVIDHVSLSWSLDENLMIHRNIPVEADPRDWPEIMNISIQRLLISEGLYPHSTGIEIGGEVEIEGWRGVHDITIHHNLFAHNDLRNPGVGALRTQVINNVVYNWGNRAAETWRNIEVDWIGNYFKPGPMSNEERPLVHGAFPKNQPTKLWPAPSLFAAGNLAPPIYYDPGGDNWAMYHIHYTNDLLPDSFRRSQPLPFISVPVQIHTAEEAYSSVLADVGANARLACDGTWVSNSDAVDRRVLADAANGTGPAKRPVADPREVGGLPPVDPGAACPDEDHDGMPDEWELAHPPLNVHDNDANGIDLHPQYTNIEVFLNGVLSGAPAIEKE